MTTHPLLTVEQVRHFRIASAGTPFPITNITQGKPNVKFFEKIRKTKRKEISDVRDSRTVIGKRSILSPIDSINPLLPKVNSKSPDKSYVKCTNFTVRFTGWLFSFPL